MLETRVEPHGHAPGGPEGPHVEVVLHRVPGCRQAFQATGKALPVLLERPSGKGVLRAHGLLRRQRVDPLLSQGL